VLRRNRREGCGRFSFSDHKTQAKKTAGPMLRFAIGGLDFVGPARELGIGR